jgi:hypothetical protein
MQKEETKKMDECSYICLSIRRGKHNNTRRKRENEWGENVDVVRRGGNNTKRRRKEGTKKIKGNLHA